MTNDLTQPIYHAIRAATGAAELHRITSQVIPNTVGITDDEREQLKLAVRHRFGALNAAAAPSPRPRWDTNGVAA